MRRPPCPSRVPSSRPLAFALVMALAAAGCGDDAADHVSNTPPTALFAVSPSSGTTATVFHVDAGESSDAEDVSSALEVRWDWEGDGTWDTARDTTKTAEHQYATVGMKTIRLEVVDAGGLTGATTEQVTVGTPANTAPVASFAVTPLSGTTDTLFTVDASASTDLEDPVSALEVRWDWEDDGTWDAAYDTTKTAEHRYQAAGRKTIRLGVRDSGGLTGTTTRIVEMPSAPPQDMALVPAGPFTMGSDSGEGYLDEQPEHALSISAFHLDLHEVTNARYAAALNWAMPQGLVDVAAGVTYGTVRQSGSGEPYLYMDGEQDAGNQCRVTYGGGVFGVESGWGDHPVVCVTWYGAAAFCNWRSVIEGLPPAYDAETWECDHNASGYRLPTEAEWEKAARGEQGERTYPWAGTTIHCDLCNFRSASGYCIGLTVEVDDPQYAGGESPYGARHMAGNVWEWCNDWFGPDYYSGSPAADPRGPASGTYRVLRGGSWDSYDGYHVRCAYRYSYLPAAWAAAIGFRTARNP